MHTNNKIAYNTSIAIKKLSNNNSLKMFTRIIVAHLLDRQNL